MEKRWRLSGSVTTAADNSDVDPINDADDDNDDNDADADANNDNDDDLSSSSLVETTKSDSAKDVERIKN